MDTGYRKIDKNTSKICPKNRHSVSITKSGLTFKSSASSVYVKVKVSVDCVRKHYFEAPIFE